ncbi:MAG: RNA 2',3'-cyclic phosphodiesterase [Candidatus Gorgyraea atricola]|nr:RNA 2',3'-cyclic phosphodiesterase [Candidatus Gorgyraea atricola]
MQTIRAFVAVEIDQPNKQKLSQVISTLKQANADVKWVNKIQMHLTLKFLGNIEENRIKEISDTLKSIADNFSAFNIHLSKIGAFPNMHKPRVIWLGIDKGAQDLKNLASQLEKLGPKEEKREYKAHLTLGRVKSLKNISQLTKLINETPFQSQGNIPITKLILFQSTLTPKGAIYSPLTTLALKQ